MLKFDDRTVCCVTIVIIAATIRVSLIKSKYIKLHTVENETYNLIRRMLANTCKYFSQLLYVCLRVYDKRGHVKV